jgi:uncharacterized protein YjiS (DUF1127 family)
MFSHSCARFLVDRLSSEETADQGLVPWTRPAPSVDQLPVRVGLFRQVADRVAARWRPQPETLDMAMARLGATSAHLLDDIGVRVARRAEAEVVIVEVTVPAARPPLREPSAPEMAIAAE